MIQSQARRLFLVEGKKKRASISSYDEGDAAAATNRSQMRRRFDLGGDPSSAVTAPNVSTRRTAPPSAPEDTEAASKRPTIPTPRPRLSLGAIPRRLVSDKEILDLPLDHRAAFVLMHIDGRTNLRTLIDVTGLVPEEVVTLVERLLELQAIAVV